MLSLFPRPGSLLTSSNIYPNNEFSVRYQGKRYCGKIAGWFHPVYEESLYKTQDGKFFLYGFGGPEFPYTEETIVRIAKDKVKAWQNA